MSNQSNPPRPNGPRPIKLQPERMPPTIASPHQLAQFTAAAAAGYSPRPQMSASAYNPPPSREPDVQIPTAPAPQTTTTPAAPPPSTPAAPPPSTPAAPLPSTPAVQPPATPATSTTSAQPATTASSGASSGSSAVQATRDEIKSYTDALNRSSIKPLAAQPITDFDKFKGFKFVALLSLIVEMREIYEKVSGTFEWEMFESQIDRCEQYLKEKCRRRRVFLVVSGALGKEIVPKVHDLPNIYAIYVFCSDISYHIPWSKKYSKVRVVCNDDTEYLIPRLAIDVAQSNIDWGNEFLKKGDREGAKKAFSDAKKNLDSDFCKKADSSMKTEVNKQLDKLK